jgi:replicative DNA helicase
MNALDHNFRIVPEARDSERTLLGTIMVKPEAYWRVSGFLKPDHFIEAINAEIYRTIGVLITEGRAIAPQTLRQYLPAGTGEATANVYLASLLVEAMPAAAAYGLGSAIVEAWMRRIGIARLEDGITMLRDMPADTSPGKIFAEV